MGRDGDQLPNASQQDYTTFINGWIVGARIPRFARSTFSWASVARPATMVAAVPPVISKKLPSLHELL
jgi:hypothetical protein